MNGLILLFSYLQILDLLTTIAFLLQGVKEANPLVKIAMAAFASPVLGLVFVKVGAILLGLLCWRLGKRVLLLRANFVFAGLVAWNLVALIAGSAAAIRG